VNHPGLPYLALGTVVGIPAGLIYANLAAALTISLIAVNLALWTAYRLWGDQAVDA
jgi:hypothetical protein